MEKVLAFKIQIEGSKELVDLAKSMAAEFSELNNQLDKTNDSTAIKNQTADFEEMATAISKVNAGLYNQLGFWSLMNDSVGSVKQFREEIDLLSTASVALGENLPDEIFEKVIDQVGQLIPEIKKLTNTEKDSAKAQELITDKIDDSNEAIVKQGQALSTSEESVKKYDKAMESAFNKVAPIKKLQGELDELKIEAIEVRDTVLELFDATQKTEGKSFLERISDKVKFEQANEGFNNIIDKAIELKNEIKVDLGNDILSGINESIKSNAFDKLSELTQILSDIADAETDLAKATGLTTIQVRELRDAFKEIDTATSENDLLAIAEEAGKLGIKGVEDIQNFTEAVDVLTVAQGDSFGSAQEVTEVYGQLRENLSNFKTGDAAKDFLHLANAVNFLQKQGAATAKGIAENAQSIAGSGKAMGLTEGQILGLATRFDELGIGATGSGKAMQGVLTVFKQAPNDIAKALNIDSTEFKNKIENDVGGALALVAKKVAESGVNGAAFSKILSGLGTDGKLTAEVLAQLGENVDILGLRSIEAGLQLEKTGSITNDFNIKNNSLSATIAKVKKELTEIFTESEFIETAEVAADVVLSLARKFTSIAKFVLEFKGVLIGLITTYTIINGLIGLHNGLIKAASVATAIQKNVTLAYSAAKTFLTGSTAGATVALRVFATALVSTGIGAIVVLLGSLASAFALSSKKADAATESQKRLNEGTSSIAKSFLEEKKAIDKLFKPLKDVNAKREDILKSIKAINDQKGDHLDFILTEANYLDRVDEAYKKVNESILQNIINKKIGEDEDFFAEKLVGVNTRIENIDETELSIFEHLSQVFDPRKDAFFLKNFRKSHEEIQKDIKNGLLKDLQNESQLSVNNLKNVKDKYAGVAEEIAALLGDFQFSDFGGDEKSNPITPNPTTVEKDLSELDKIIRRADIGKVNLEVAADEGSVEKANARIRASIKELNDFLNIEENQIGSAAYNALSEGKQLEISENVQKAKDEIASLTEAITKPVGPTALDKLFENADLLELELSVTTDEESIKRVEEEIKQTKAGLEKELAANREVRKTDKFKNSTNAEKTKVLEEAERIESRLGELNEIIAEPPQLSALDKLLQEAELQQLKLDVAPDEESAEKAKAAIEKITKKLETELQNNYDESKTSAFAEKSIEEQIAFLEKTKEINQKINNLNESIGKGPELTEVEALLQEAEIGKFNLKFAVDKESAKAAKKELDVTSGKLTKLLNDKLALINGGEGFELLTPEELEKLREDAEAIQQGIDGVEGAKEEGSGDDKFDKFNEEFQKYGDAAKEAITAFDGFMDALDQRRINRIKKDGEKQLKLAGKNAALRAKIEEQTEKKIAKIERKAARRKKITNIATAVMNGALAITNIIAKEGPLNPAAIASIAIAAVLTAAQVATIAAQPLGRRGGLVDGIIKGNSHEQGGVPALVRGNRPLELEGGEAVVNKTNLKSRKPLTVSGTPAEIVSAINAMGGNGVDFSPGATITPLQNIKGIQAPRPASVRVINNNVNINDNAELRLMFAEYNDRMLEIMEQKINNDSSGFSDGYNIASL